MRKLACLFCCMLGFVLSFAQTTTRDKVNAVLQKKGEAKLLIKAQEEDLELLARTVSLDYRHGEEYLAYVNEKQFERFCETGLDYRLFEDNGPKTVLMAETTDEMLSWNRYPVYGIYVEMMQDFARQYGTLCRLDTIGFSTDDRLILALACGSNVHSDQGKPKFFYSSSIHGDELLGMIMLLRLADHLLGSYQTDASARLILDSIDLFICPLANPDGAYGWNENSVTGARRYNANYVDLNRNFPDPVYGAHSDNEEYQDETLAFMDYAKKNRFDVSINIHGGAEVCNYPWDCWPTDERTHPDREWFRKICSSFIDSVRIHAPSAYFTGINPEGMTDGSDWYNVFGGRQDYHNWFLRCRELTLEISNTKTPSSDMLTTYWDYLKGGLVSFMESTLEGVNGTVTSAESNQAIDSADVEVTGLDNYNLNVITKADGYYYRGLPAGEYTLKINAEGYRDTLIQITVPYNELLRLDIKLQPSDVGIKDTRIAERDVKIYPNPCSESLCIEAESCIAFEILDMNSRTVHKGRLDNGTHTVDVSFLPSGYYIMNLYGRENGMECSKSFVKR